MALKGRGLKFKASTNGTTFNDVTELNSASMTHTGNNQDITKFGDAEIRRIQGLKDGTYSASGFYSGTDTQGQKAIRDAWLNDTALHVQFLPDGTTGFKQEVKVASYEVSASVDGSVEVSYELEGAGPITAV